MKLKKNYSTDIASDLAEALTFDISSDIEKAKQTVSKSEKFGDVTLDLKVSKIIPFQISVNYYGLDFYAVAEGNAKVLVEPK
jgi:hypothetical protein